MHRVLLSSFNKIDRIHYSMLDVQCSMFDVRKFLFRSDWPFFLVRGGARMKLHFLTTCCQIKPDKGLYPDKLEITNYKHHLILKLGQINSKLQYPNLK